MECTRELHEICCMVEFSGASREENVKTDVAVTKLQSLEAQCVERGERKGEGKQWRNK